MNGIDNKQIRIGVCVKGMDFVDEDELSVRGLAEWIELNRQMGANSITIYNYYVPKRIRRLLNHYQSSGFVNVVNVV